MYEYGGTDAIYFGCFFRTKLIEYSMIEIDIESRFRKLKGWSNIDFSLTKKFIRIY